MLPILKSLQEINRRIKLNREVIEINYANVQDILSAVRKQGDSALIDLTQTYDGVVLSDISIAKQEIIDAKQLIDDNLKFIVNEAAENIRRFHFPQFPDSYTLDQPDGTVVTWNWRPIDRVGIYVPGGNYPLLSTLLMNVIPAQVAGVKEIAVCTPPNQDGLPDKTILATCDLLGIDEIYGLGGAQAISALAYGSESVQAVHKITGPGNAYVTAAKQLVSSYVGIDMAAGPTEVIVIADENAKPEYVAAELISQAEHDINAIAVLLTNSRACAKQVIKEITRLTAQLITSGTIVQSLMKNGFIFVADSIAECMDISNTIAPEHLSLQTKDASSLKDGAIAGAIFIGSNTPVAWGDYWSGANHTLPTSGQSRYRGPLNVLDFMVPYSIIDSSNAIANSGEKVIDFANSEGLFGHAESIKVRLK